MAAYFFASPIDVDVMLEGEDLRKKAEAKVDKDRVVQCPVYYDGESIVGQVRPRPRRCARILRLAFGR
jgi:vacuolar protein sorting-associated protein 26